MECTAENPFRSFCRQYREVEKVNGLSGKSATFRFLFGLEFPQRDF